MIRRLRKVAAVVLIGVAGLIGGAAVVTHSNAASTNFVSTMQALTAIYNQLVLNGQGGGGGTTGTDGSDNPPSLAGLNLLSMFAANPTRQGYVIQAQDTAAHCSVGGGANGLVVALDDGTGANLTVLYLGYATASPGQGGSVSWVGMPHSGRIRYYGTAGCIVGAHEW